MSKKENVKKESEFKVEFVDKFGDGDFFDDCPICQAMKRAKESGRTLSEEELKEAFKKAGEQGAAFGGEWLKGTDK